MPPFASALPQAFAGSVLLRLRIGRRLLLERPAFAPKAPHVPLAKDLTCAAVKLHVCVLLRTR